MKPETTELTAMYQQPESIKELQQTVDILTQKVETYKSLYEHYNKDYNRLENQMKAMKALIETFEITI